MTLERKGVLARRVFLLVASGAISSAALAVLASGQLALLSAEVLSAVLRLIPLQILAVTVAKFGGDSLAFAIASGQPMQGLAHWHRILRLCLPLGVVTSFVLFGMANFDWPTIIAAVVSVIADMIAVQLMADLNARHRMGLIAMASVLNYPLFIALLFIADAFGSSQSLAVVISLFATSSLARLGWCAYWYSTISRNLTFISPPVNTVLAVQQCLNVCIYRGDQMLVGALGLGVVGGSAQLEAFFLFMVRFPELVSAAVSTLGPVYLPAVYSSSNREWAASVRKWGPLYVAIVLSILTWAAAAFSLLGVHAEVTNLANVLPFALGATLSMPVFALSYSMMRAGQLRRLVAVLTLGVGIGGVLASVATATYVPQVLFWIVPVQLGAVVLIGAIVPWRAMTPAW